MSRKPHAAQLDLFADPPSPPAPIIPTAAQLEAEGKRQAVFFGCFESEAKAQADAERFRKVGPEPITVEREGAQWNVYRWVPKPEERKPFLCGCGATFTEAEAATMAEDEEGHIVCRSCELEQEQAIAQAEAEAEQTHPAYADEDENKRGEWRDDAQLEHYRVSSLAKAAKIERLEWLEGNKRAGMSAGAGRYLLEWFEDEGRFYARTDRQMHNSGGSGPYGEVKGIADRSALILHFMRRVLSDAAHAHAMRWCSDGETRQKQFEKLAAWAIGQCPALIYAADLATEFEAMKAEAEEKERNRCAMLKGSSELREQLCAARYAFEGGDEENRRNEWAIRMYGQPDAWSRADVQLQGDFPHRMRVMIYSAKPHYQGEIKDEETPEQLEALRAALAEAMPCPVVIAPRELQIAHYYPTVRAEVTYAGDPHRRYHLQQLGMSEDASKED